MSKKVIFSHSALRAFISWNRNGIIDNTFKKRHILNSSSNISKDKGKTCWNIINLPPFYHKFENNVGRKC
ncbi:MAG: hypothetical protein WBF33_28720 [Candidatus Nitrosopolaris sp.]